ncbi:hypothetical protein B0H12DRAFT_1133709 [Mycena haematopus]|nr:hypothetical protein B0H12DRAFT_1133709 [Mycena haematopus]
MHAGQRTSRASAGPNIASQPPPQITSICTMILQILLPIAATFLCYVLFHASQILYRNLTSPLRYVDGPKNPSFIFGNFKEMGDDAYLTSKWREQFGGTFRFNGLFSTSELHTTDIKAVTHVVTRPDIYQKAEAMRTSSELLLGRGMHLNYVLKQKTGYHCSVFNRYSQC